MQVQSHPDVFIVGAGLIGASIAWRLSQSGLRVRLADAGRFGGEASSAGAGMLSPGGEFDRPSVWIELGLASMRLYPAFVEALESDTGCRIDFKICGCTEFVFSDEELPEALQRALFQSSAGIRVESTPEGLFYPDDGLVAPADLLGALRTACQRRSVEIEEQRAIDQIECSEYAAVVIAAGAWSGNISVMFRNERVPLPQTTPVKGHLLGFDLPPGTLGPIRRHGASYVVQRSNGFTVAGSTEETVGFDRSIDAAACNQIHRGAAELFPTLEDVAPSKRWIGFRPRAEGEGPHIRQIEGTNVWLAYGHYRNGILLAPLTADRVAAEIAR